MIVTSGPALLQQMVTMHMLWELEHFLQRLQTAPVLWSPPVLATAWQAVLVNPLSKDKDARAALMSLTCRFPQEQWVAAEQYFKVAL
ncbi:hypothetical protein ACOMHN_056714 [Nucella lapillus]